MDLYNAEKQFKENANLFGDPQSQPEKFNLYHGLANLTRALINLEGEINIIVNDIRQIKNHLKQR